MPFYDYKCSRCGKTFEALHGMGTKPAGLKCEFCSSADIQRVFHPISSLRGGSNLVDMPTSSSGGGCSSCSSGTCGSCH